MVGSLKIHWIRLKWQPLLSISDKNQCLLFLYTAHSTLIVYGTNNALFIFYNTLKSQSRRKKRDANDRVQIAYV